MNYNPAFGPAAQTREQRARVLQQMQATFPRLKTKASAYARQLYERYVAGELSWLQVRQALDIAAQ
ncbi:hypothetical protein GKZ68_09820 [Hymenobacter sp. BRD128]|uniref:hypothetical protein n=1 Tax=Hymenobacter sp. BRD128 TaxID=2675878 RepID=UPI00156350DA|nr:hypothetical protein [Hymenobacter sp. BRD128]QKG56897.1 hypothetical protein GKZ68_09820 [Hymenobacter sp. BRD128]